MRFDRLALGQPDSIWRGTKRLHMEPPPAPHVDSESVMRVRRVWGSRFLQCNYTWSHEGRTHEGVLLIGVRKKDGAATGAWIDSWHQSGEPMMLRGALETPAGVISVCGTFGAPPDPDWGWRITLEMPDADRLVMMMYVATPAGEEALAVRATYDREP